MKSTNQDLCKFGNLTFIKTNQLGTRAGTFFIKSSLAFVSEEQFFFFFLVCTQFTQIKFPLFAHLRLGNPVGIRLVAAKFVDKIELLRTT